MTENLIENWSQIYWVIGSILALCAFAITVAVPLGGRTKPASKGFRPEEDESTVEEIRPDGYVDTFSGEVAEAGGGLPPVMKLVVPVTLLGWILYLVFNWASIPGGQ